MTVRVGWLPTGTQGAEDTRAATGMTLTPSGLLVPQAGVIPAVSSAQPFALTSTGSLSCSVGPGQAIVVPGASTSQGAYPVTVDATGGGLPTLTFAAGGSLARTDVIYIQVQDTAEDGSGVTAGKVARVQGTNGGGVPAVPSGAVPLWQVPVPATATSINFATAVYVGAPTVSLGGVIPSASSGYPASAITGQVRARTDRAGTAAPGPLEVWDGATWNPAIPASMPRGIVAAPTTTSATSSALTASAETFDTTVLGYYSCNLVAGRRYLAIVNGLQGQGTVANDNWRLRIRDSQSASNPTSASTSIAVSQWEVPISSTLSRETITLQQTFLCTVTGPHTFGVSVMQAATGGTGTFTALNARELYVEDIGNV